MAWQAHREVPVQVHSLWDPRRVGPEGTQDAVQGEVWEGSPRGSVAITVMQRDTSHRPVIGHVVSETVRGGRRGLEGRVEEGTRMARDGLWQGS